MLYPTTHLHTSPNRQTADQPTPLIGLSKVATMAGLECQEVFAPDMVHEVIFHPGPVGALGTPERPLGIMSIVAAADFIVSTSRYLQEAVSLSALLLQIVFFKYAHQSIIDFSEAAFFVKRLFVDLSGTNETNVVHLL